MTASKIRKYDWKNLRSIFNFYTQAALRSPTKAILALVTDDSGKAGTAHLKLGSRNIFFIADPEHAEKLFRNNEATQKINLKHEPFSFFGGKGIFSKPLAEWKTQRAILNRHLRPVEIEKSYGDLTSRIDRFANTGNKNDFNPYLEIRRLSLSCLFEDLFHYPVQKRDLDPLLDAIAAINKEVYPLTAWSLLTPFGGLYKRASNFKLRHHLSYIGNFLEKVINDRVSAQNQPDDILTQTIQNSSFHLSQSKENKENLKDELLQFIFAGHETPAAQMTWMMYLFAARPETQQRVLQEMESINHPDLPLNGGKNLPFLDGFIKEALRLFTLSNAVPRQTIKDFQLTQDTIIPSGSFVIVPLNIIHRDPQWFPEPKSFDPERQIPATNKDGQKCPYMPFLQGPHTCPGKAYFMMMTHAFLFKMIKTYRIEFKNSAETMPEAQAHISVIPLKNTRLNLVRRDGRTLADEKDPNAHSAQTPVSKCPFHNLFSSRK